MTGRQQEKPLRGKGSQEARMIFVARYRDGICGIVEASDEASARQLLESNDTWVLENDKIVSLRPLSQPFVSLWSFHSTDSDDLEEIDLLGGILTERVAEEIHQHEYPMILVAHSTCEQEESFRDRDSGKAASLLTNAGLEQWDRWEENLKRRLRQAVQLELRRFE
jgi:hypothetical protein